YFRAKVGRRLQRLGAVAIKNAVYVLPSTEQTREDLQWVAREIAQEGGDATVCEANLVDGLKDEQVEAIFQAARQKDYEELAAELHDLVREVPRKRRGATCARARAAPKAPRPNSRRRAASRARAAQEATGRRARDRLLRRTGPRGC